MFAVVTETSFVARCLAIRSLESIFTLTSPCYAATLLVMSACAHTHTVGSKATFRTWFLTSLSKESWRTAAIESSLHIVTHTTILAWGGAAFVDLNVTVSSSKAGVAYTCVHVDTIDAFALCAWFHS